MPVTIKPRRPNRRNSSDPEEFRATLGEHVGELRDRILRCVFLIAATWAVAWFVLHEPLYKALEGVVNAAVLEYRKTHPGFEYIEPFFSATEAFMLKLKFSFMVGLGMALPFIVLQIWGFVEPGLKPNESKPIKALAPASVALFCLGVYFCWIILPTTFAWFLSYFEEFPGTALHQQPGTMIFFTLKLMLAFGIGFQLPLVVFIAAKLGIIGPDTISHYWRQAVVFVFVASAVLTPSGDIFTMLMMAVPMTILLVLSILAVKLTTKTSKSRDPELDDLD